MGYITHSFADPQFTPHSNNTFTALDALSTLLHMWILMRILNVSERLKTPLKHIWKIIVKKVANS